MNITHTQLTKIIFIVFFLLTTSYSQISYAGGFADNMRNNNPIESNIYIEDEDDLDVLSNALLDNDQRLANITTITLLPGVASDSAIELIKIATKKTTTVTTLPPKNESPNVDQLQQWIAYNLYFSKQLIQKSQKTRQQSKTQSTTTTIQPQIPEQTTTITGEDLVQQTVTTTAPTITTAQISTNLKGNAPQINTTLQEAKTPAEIFRETLINTYHRELQDEQAHPSQEPELNEQSENVKTLLQLLFADFPDINEKYKGSIDALLSDIMLFNIDNIMSLNVDREGFENTEHLSQLITEIVRTQARLVVPQQQPTPPKSGWWLWPFN